MNSDLALETTSRPQGGGADQLTGRKNSTTTSIIIKNDKLCGYMDVVLSGIR